MVFFASGLDTHAPNRGSRTPVLRNSISYNLMSAVLRPGCRSRFRWPRSKANAAGKSGFRVCLLDDLVSGNLCTDDLDTSFREENVQSTLVVPGTEFPFPPSRLISSPLQDDDLAVIQLRVLSSAHVVEATVTSVFSLSFWMRSRGWEGGGGLLWALWGVSEFGTKAR